MKYLSSLCLCLVLYTVAVAGTITSDVFYGKWFKGTPNGKVTSTSGVFNSISSTTLNTQTLSYNKISTPGVVSASLFANFSTAVNDPSTTGKIIQVDSPITIGNLSVNRTVQILETGNITIESGKHAAFNKPIIAERNSVFLGSGTVALANTVLYPEWWGAKADYVIGGAAITDSTAALNTASVVAKNTGATISLGKGNYLISSTVTFDGCPVEGADAYYTMLVSKVELAPAVRLIGARKIYRNIGIWFDLPSLATTAVGMQFASNTYGTAADQFSNNIVEQCYVRNAYRSFSVNSAGTTGTVWNNTFINCRSDFAVEYGWYFNAIVGSTTQTWLNCMIDGVLGGVASAGWYINNVDDVAWVNCQADDMADGKAIYINLATSALIENFRSESSYLTTNGSRLIYANASLTLSNVKAQSTTFNPGAGNRATIVGLGTTGKSIIGNINLESCDIQSGTMYKLDTNGLTNREGTKCVVIDNIQRSEVRVDDTGDKTVFANKAWRVTASNADPTAGNFEIGDIIGNVAISPTTAPRISRVCTTAGTAGTLAGVTGSITSGSTTLTVNSAADIAEGVYLTITGVSGAKRVVHKFSSTVVYIDTPANTTVSDAAVAYSAPVFRVSTHLVAKGATGARPILGATDYGIMYLDTTLDADGYPIWWNGTKWIKSDGTDA